MILINLFPFLSLCCYPRGCLITVNCFFRLQRYGCHTLHSQFILSSFSVDFEIFWSDSCKEFSGDYRLVKKLGTLGKRLRQWNKSTFGNQNSKLVDIQNSITTIEDLSEVRLLSETKKTKLKNLNSKLWEVECRGYLEAKIPSKLVQNGG